MIDFERCAKRAHLVFVANDWEWAGRGIPTRDEIYRMMLMLYDDVADKELEPGEKTMAESGRIRVQREAWEGEGISEYVFLVLGNDFDIDDV